ncbi:HGE-14 family type IV secretion system effector [Anaplasma phagocytophilum]|nr:hypothetical protein [Anaplasma phagocytophilum]
MHTPRIFTTPVMSGYAYSGLSSREYKDSLCRAITTGLMSYEEFLKVMREFMLELRSTFNELRDVDVVFAANADRMEFIVNSIDTESTKSEGLGEEELYRLVRHLNDTLYDCATAACNQDVARFIDPDFCRRGVHLQIAKACGILANAIAIVHYFARTVAQTSDSAMGERSASSEYHICAVAALSTSLGVRFSALSRCLNSSPGSEETKRRKAILRVVRHNMELCCRVAELIDQEIPGIFCNRIESCLKKIVAAVESSSTECEEMVRGDAVAQFRLSFAKKAMIPFKYHLNRYIKGSEDPHIRCARWYLGVLGQVKGALCSVIGTLFLIYRGYASTGNSDHSVAGIIEHCLRILLALPSTRKGLGAYNARKVYVDMCSVYEDIEQRARPELLLNPGAEVRWRDAALRYLREIMDIWVKKYGKHFNAVEQPDASPSQSSTSYAHPSTSGLGSTAAGQGAQLVPPPPHIPLRVLENVPYPSSQPSTSGLGSTSAGMGSQQAPYMPPYCPGIMHHAYAQPSTSYAHPSTSWDQPSTSGLGGAAGLGQQAPYIPPHDPGIMSHAYAQPSTSYAHPSTSWDQPSTSGFGSTRAGKGRSQAPYVSPQDQGIMPYLWDQPSTSGLGGTSTGMRDMKVSYVTLPALGSMARIYTQPSTSGLGGASSTLEEAQVSTHRSQTPDDDEDEQPSKRARYR